MLRRLIWTALISITAFAQTSTSSNPQASPTLQNAPIADFKKKGADDWARLLPGLLPGIQKCINDGGVPVLFVVNAWPMDQGMVGVRLLTNQKKQYECVAARTGMRIESMRPAKAGDPKTPVKWNPIYYPAREEQTTIECGRVERVMEKKMFLGWLQYEPCEK